MARWITMTQAHIDLAKKCRREMPSHRVSEICPLAQVLKARFRRPVLVARVDWCFRSECEWYDLTKPMRKVRSDFDARRRVYPQSFLLPSIK